MCAFHERNTHASQLGEFCAKLFYNLGSLFSSFLSVCGIPKSFGCISTTCSEKQMEFSETQRDSNPLEKLFFFFFSPSQQLFGPELEPFHRGEIWSLTSSVCCSFC